MKLQAGSNAQKEKIRIKSEVIRKQATTVKNIVDFFCNNYIAGGCSGRFAIKIERLGEAIAVREGSDPTQ